MRYLHINVSAGTPVQIGLSTLWPKAPGILVLHVTPIRGEKKFRFTRLHVSHFAVDKAAACA